LKSITLLLVFVGLTLQVTGQTSSRFADYEVAIYRGTIHRPKWIRRVADDEWRDELGKLVEPPEINFAGKYFVSVHSCGTGCRYYTLTDLSSGRELDLLKDFGAAEPPPTTREGNPYVTDLVTHPNNLELPGRSVLCLDFVTHVKQDPFTLSRLLSCCPL